jgi:hypothetical protein
MAADLAQTMFLRDIARADMDKQRAAVQRAEERQWHQDFLAGEEKIDSMLDRERGRRQTLAETMGKLAQYEGKEGPAFDDPAMQQMTELGRQQARVEQQAAEAKARAEAEKAKKKGEAEYRKSVDPKVIGEEGDIEVQRMRDKQAELDRLSREKIARIGARARTRGGGARTENLVKLYHTDLMRKRSDLSRRLGRAEGSFMPSAREAGKGMQEEIKTTDADLQILNQIYASVLSGETTPQEAEEQLRERFGPPTRPIPGAARPSPGGGGAEGVTEPTTTKGGGAWTEATGWVGEAAKALGFEPGETVTTPGGVRTSEQQLSGDTAMFMQLLDESTKAGVPPEELQFVLGGQEVAQEFAPEEGSLEELRALMEQEEAALPEK